MKAKTKKPLVCIVIVNWNGGQKIIDCLTSLKKTKYPNYKVILVDNGSEDKSSIDTLLKINKKMDVIKLPKNFGYTVGTNTGWKYALKKYNADYICAMDSDIVTIQPDWLDIEIRELEKRPEWGISCGKLVFTDNRLQGLWWGRDAKNYAEKDNGQYDFIKVVPALCGACIVIKSSTIRKIGYYDENFFYGPNDVDYCLRAGKHGIKTVYNGLSKSIHIGSGSYLASNQTKIFGEQSYGLIIFESRHNGLLAGIKMILRQFVRIFMTRKSPDKKRTFDNINFHTDIIKRGFILLRSTISALRNYKRIKANSYKGEF